MAGRPWGRPPPNGCTGCTRPWPKPCRPWRPSRSPTWRVRRWWRWRRRPRRSACCFRFLSYCLRFFRSFGVPPPGVEYRWGLGRVREGKDLGAPVGPCGGSWGTVRRTGPGSGSSDHSSEPSVSAGAFASRRRDAISRAAPPPSTTTAASAISAMPAPVWARVLR